MIKTNQKGITLIALIITIIVMFILMAVTINVGTGSIEQSQMMNFISYMQAIQTKVDLISEYEDYMKYGEELNTTQVQTLERILNKEDLLTSTDSIYLRVFNSNKISEELQIDNVDDEIVIDFNTREVISLNGIILDGEMYYTQYDLPGGQVLVHKTESLDRTLAFERVETNINGLNATFVIKGIGITNGTLSYGTKNSEGDIKWITITNYTTKDTDVETKNITESGTYYFRVQDNTTGKDNATTDDKGNKVYTSVELKLTNSPKLEGDLTDLSTSYNYSNLNDSTKWAFATDSTDTANLKYYVWIPRFAYKVDSEGSAVKDENEKVYLEFLRGTSDVTSSGGYISIVQDDDGNSWVVPDAFTEGTSQKTGVWVQVDTPNKTRYRYN